MRANPRQSEEKFRSVLEFQQRFFPKALARKGEADSEAMRGTGLADETLERIRHRLAEHEREPRPAGVV